MNWRPVISTLASLALLGAGRTTSDGSQQSLSPDLRSTCYNELTAALGNESQWVRAHAAEALVQSKRPDPALAAFGPKADTAEPKYRVVVWRILAQGDPAQRRRYIDRIRKALLDPTGPDRTHAMEALAKLYEPAADEAERRCVLDIADAQNQTSPFAAWRLAQANDPTAVERLVKLLRADDVVTRARAAYVLGRLWPLPDSARNAIAVTLQSEPADSPARAMLQTAQGTNVIRKVAQDGGAAPSARYFAAMSLADLGTAHDYTMLTGLLGNSDADVRVAAAYALLQIDLRTAAAVAPATRPG